MKIFICAAGKGSRIEKISKGKPKSLLEVSNYSLLEYLLLIFSSNKKVKQIHLIVGYKKELFISKFGTEYNKVPIFYHVNDKYQFSSNLYSLYCARKFFNGDVCFTNADLVIDPKLVDLFLNEKNGNKVLLDTQSITSDLESVKLIVDKGVVTGISNPEDRYNLEDGSKNLKKVLNQFSASAAGLYYMSQFGSDLFFKYAEKIFEIEGKNVGFAKPIPYMAKESPFYVSSYKNYVVFDVDNENDFIRAQKTIPKLYSNFL